MNNSEREPGHIEYLKDIFRKWSGKEANSLTSLPESGSVRKYYRISGNNHLAVGVFNPDRRENTAFIYLTGHFKQKGINVPEVYAEDLNHYVYLIEDLGNILLFDYIRDNTGNNESIVNIYKSVIREMPGLQVDAVKDLDFSKCYPRAAFDRQSMFWDLHYFKSYFLKLTGIMFDEQELEDDFNVFVKFLMKAKRDFFLFRDFQSRNIMLHNGKIYFIDYQGGRKGALQYDLASLLFDAKACLSPEVRTKLLDFYIETISAKIKVNRKEFLEFYNGYTLIRMMQAFGAYGFRGYFERKPVFLQSIPPAIRNLEWFMDHIRLKARIPCLQNCFKQIIASDFIKDFEIPAEGLTLSVNSFSFKNGIPPDNTGNGGGFVFDCRALPNPGRYDQYKTFTGKDDPVILFFKDRPEVKEFINHIYMILDRSIQKYLSRNFSHLMISFGCTGGQHRSVYCAEEISRLIEQNYSIRVVIRHRELENFDKPAAYDKNHM